MKASEAHRIPEISAELSMSLKDGLLDDKTERFDWDSSFEYKEFNYKYEIDQEMRELRGTERIKDIMVEVKSSYK
jgi:hypothetical protein